MAWFWLATLAFGRRLACTLIGILFLVPMPRVQGQDSVTLTWDLQCTLRELAETHLQDPDAWPEILRANGLESADQLQPGISLEIPVAAILGLEHAIGELRALIYRATEAGAQVFATEAISQARTRKDEALKARGQGALDEALEAAERGVVAARDALEISIRNRNLPAEAVLDAAGGKVQRRRPTAFDWTPVAVKALLEEQERLRTLARSFAVVRFRDASTLRLDENAQLAIRRMRHDRLTRREKVDVVLHGGSLRALIDPRAGRGGLQVEVPGIDLDVRSRAYWMRTSRQDTRLANYDGEIEVSARGGTVVVGEKQGTLVKSDRAPENPVDLLTAPDLQQPEDDRVLYGAGVDFTWVANERAAAYWLEVARDDRFEELVFSGAEIGRNGYYLPVTEDGIYHWRVSSVDVLGLPGPPSDSRRFRLSLDRTPPFLLVTTPLDGRRVHRGESVAVSGRTEPGASLTLNGDPVPVEQDGHFATELACVEGVNRLLLEALDPAGNPSREERTLDFSPGSEWVLRIAEGTPRDEDGRLVVDHSPFSLAGTTLPSTSLHIETSALPDFQASAAADENGRFHLTLPAHRDAITEFVLHAEGPSGQRDEQRFEVVVDTVDPEIHLDGRLPNRVATPTLSLSGRVEGGAGTTMTRIDKAIPLSPEGRFALDVRLQAGANPISLTARDLAGNWAEWQGVVVLDQEAPELVDFRVSSEQTVMGRILVVEISAEDASGLTVGIPYSLQVGRLVHKGVARRCADRRCHRDRAVLPPATAGRARLLSVTLQDYLGNRKEVQLD